MTIGGIYFLVGLIVAGLMLARNGWVYHSRKTILDKGLRQYYRLPSYDKMMWSVWCWDVEKFIQASGISNEHAKQRLKDGCSARCKPECNCKCQGK